MGNEALAALGNFHGGSRRHGAVDDGEFWLVLFDVLGDYIGEFVWVSAWNTNLQGVDAAWNFALVELAHLCLIQIQAINSKTVFRFSEQCEEGVADFA